MKLAFNHVGYGPDARKRILIQAPADADWDHVALLQLPAGEEVWRTVPRACGSVAGWHLGSWWEIDAGGVTAPGRYAVRWVLTDGATGQGEGFEIREGLLGPALISDVLFHIKSQRSSGIWDKADSQAPRLDDRVARDVSGGWFDASGDNSKYLSHLSYANVMNPQQNPMVTWTLGRAWQRYAGLGSDDYFRERLRDEAIHGADWLMRMQDEVGYWYVTVFDRWSKDPAQRELCTYATQEGHKGADYQAGWRQGGGMAVAALALAARLGGGGAYSADEYRSAALKGFRHLIEHGRSYLDDGTENLIDETCALLAAAELATLVPEEDVLAELDRRLRETLARGRETDGHVWLAMDDAGERSWFHASDAGLPAVALARAAELHPDREDAAAARDFAVAWLESLVSLGDDIPNPFGYPPHWVKVPGEEGRRQWFYPHDNPSGYWWQGENAKLASLAGAVWTVAPAHVRLVGAASRWVDWILGANPFDACMMHGRGRNNPHYEDDGAFNAPGGVCNGVTAGFENEADIAFQPSPWNDDPDQSWRWGEQWLPNAAWLLYALAVRDTHRAC